MNGASTSKRGSKILVSNLPMDVGESEVDELFKRTVGPLQDVFLVYNNKANSKGMAVVTFQRPGDAVAARVKYNGKTVDNRHRMKVEIILDADEVSSRPPPAQQAGPPSLLSRLGGNNTTTHPKPVPKAAPIKAAPVPPLQPKVRPVKKTPHAAAPQIVVGKKRVKKGAKRVKKTAAQLDQEMEDYRASVEV
ncbi:hypothetical protein BV25DRAFT_1823406 [Artomyces pyxidatus]|uniref:Uncharacterized protein n=1 Tax=Artomyces pyxidatus TaxID=48021 RepID=A0ACB8T6T2_9AGAM|nr:hypothetical protein BV25DRAFT_1823406 [Artomyces pyxidatus]